MINHSKFDVANFIICGERKYYQLHYGHHEDDGQQRLIAEDLPEFFREQKADGSHANRILNVFKLTIRKKSAMPPRINVSFQSAPIPLPLIITSFTIV